MLESSASMSFSELAKETSVPETIPLGSLVVKVGLVGSLGESVSLSLEGPSRYLFSIDQSGVIRTVHGLNYEAHPSHWLTVLAKNVISGKILAKMDVFIKVSDENECVPLTTEPSYRFVTANLGKNHC